MVTAQDVLNLAVTKVGYGYSQGPSRTTGAQHYFDCSGFTFFLLEHLGIRPTGWDAESHLQALYCRDHGLLAPGPLASQEQIDNVPIGGLLFEGPQHAYVGGYGIPGHVAVRLSKEHTVEAMGTAWGTCIGRVAGRGWSNGGRFPNVEYAADTVDHPHPEPAPGLELQGDDMPSFIPARAKIVNGRIPEFSLDVQSDQVFVRNGARLRWRMADTPANAPYQKPEVLGTGTSTILVYKIPTHGPHHGCEEVRDRRTLLPNNVGCVTAFDGGCAFFDIVLPK